MRLQTPERIVLVLGDQLSPDISSLQTANKNKDLILMAEVADEANYVPHHKKKIGFLLSAMRHFAGELSDAGWTVRYIKLDDPDNTGSLEGELERALNEVGKRSAVMTEAGEHRLVEAMSSWARNNSIHLEVLEDHRFICTHAEFREWTKDRKQLRMEYFYRDMRRKTGLLMDGDKPEGGQWNFDAENRKPAKNSSP